jgi:sulfatase maturation enzyme AslB (radical SAM superfamily)
MADQQRSFMEKVELATRWRRNQLLRPAKWLAYSTGQTKLVPPPDRLYIESTNICNLSCIMCPTGRKEQVRKKGYIDFELFKSIVDEMAPWVQATTLHIWGEPLMHPKMFDMIDYCRKKGLRSEISTNAPCSTKNAGSVSSMRAWARSTCVSTACGRKRTSRSA